MIHGIGTDILDVDRMQKAMSEKGFCERIFTPLEIEYCLRGASPAIRSRCLAARFCAKEAFFKALGTGLRDGLAWKDVEVVNDPLGKPEFNLYNRARETTDRAGIARIHLSLSHSHKDATAIVVLEKEDS